MKASLLDDVPPPPEESPPGDLPPGDLPAEEPPLMDPAPPVDPPPPDDPPPPIDPPPEDPPPDPPEPPAPDPPQPPIAPPQPPVAPPSGPPSPPTASSVLPLPRPSSPALSSNLPPIVFPTPSIPPSFSSTRPGDISFPLPRPSVVKTTITTIPFITPPIPQSVPARGSINLPQQRTTRPLASSLRTSLNGIPTQTFIPAGSGNERNSNTHSNRGVIIGAVIGSIVGSLLLILIAYLLSRRQRAPLIQLHNNKYREIDELPHRNQSYQDLKIPDTASRNSMIPSVRFSAPNLLSPISLDTTEISAPAPISWRRVESPNTIHRLLVADSPAPSVLGLALTSDQSSARV